MNQSHLTQALDKAAGYLAIASTGYRVDINGKSIPVNGNDTRRYAGLAAEIVNGLILELESEKETVS